MRRLSLALPCLIALGLIALAAPALAEDRAPASVTVTGEAREDARPDIAIVTLEALDERPTAVDASAENARLVGAILDGLKVSGLEAKDITTFGASLSPVFSEQRDPKTGQIVKSVVTGYSARNEIRIRVREIARAGAIIGAAVQNGALYQNLAFDLSDREARIDALRGKAAANAARRASLYAEGVGMKAGPVRSLNAAADGAAPALMMAPRVFAAAAPGPTSLLIEPGTIDLTATVNATFDLVTP